MVGALELSRVRCRLVGFSRVASKVSCLPIKPDRVRKYLGGTRYQYILLYPESISGPGGSTTSPSGQMQSTKRNSCNQACHLLALRFSVFFTSVFSDKIFYVFI